MPIRSHITAIAGGTGAGKYGEYPLFFTTKPKIAPLFQVELNLPCYLGQPQILY